MRAIISKYKLRKWAVLSFNNGMRLHEDSIYLFNKGSLPSSLLLSILALEELGKEMLLDDYLWKINIDVVQTVETDKLVLEILYNHKYKQSSFAFNIDLPDQCTKYIKRMFDGQLEIDKQSATYVGLPKIRRKMQINGRLQNPNNISKSRVIDQITIVNDSILLFALGCIKGTIMIDNPEIVKLLTNKLVNRYRKYWSIMSRKTKKMYNQLLLYRDIPIDER